VCVCVSDREERVAPTYYDSVTDLCPVRKMHSLYDDA
jgi:hypothetical protein